MYKEILEEKSATIILLWDEILDDIDDNKDVEEFQMSMDFQLKIKHKIKILESFIGRDRSTSVSDVNQNNIKVIFHVPIASPNVPLLKIKLK